MKKKIKFEKKIKCEKKINDGKYKLIFLLCIVFFVEFRIYTNQLFRSSSNVIAINRHMRRVLRKIHRKKKKTHLLRGV